MNTKDSDYARGYKQGRFDADMDRLNEEEPATKDSETPKSVGEIAERLSNKYGITAEEKISVALAVAEALQQQTERHAQEINRILNLHSKPIAEGGLDYVKAFEEMERYEHRLFSLTRKTS